jgi:F-type H+-transporting ATPase subunit delta
MPESLDQQMAVAAVYADALFDLARRQGIEADVADELAELDRLCQQNDDFRRFVSTRALAVEHRAASLDRMFRGKLSDITLNTLQVMNENDRGELIPALNRAFIARRRAAANEVEVRVVSAFDLDDGQRAEIERTAREISGKNPVIAYSVDPSLLGGLVLQIGDVRYDYSVRQQLEAARDRLVQRGERGLKVTVGA